MKKILLTGHNGSIGTNLTPFLLEKGHTVVPISNDIRNYAKTREMFELHKDADWVVHLAATVNTALCNLAGRHTFDTNVKAAYNMAELAKEFNMKYCFFSTTAIYQPGIEPITETSPKKPATLYGFTKYLGEQTSYFSFKDKLQDLLIIRPCFAFGGINDHSIGSKLIQLGIDQGHLHLQLDPDKYKDYMHVENLSEAIEMLLSQDISGDYNISYGKPRKFKEMVEIVNQMGYYPIIYYRPELDYMQNHIVDNSKLKSIIDWKPTITLEEGLKKVEQQIINKNN